MQSFKTLLKSSFDFYKANWKELMMLILPLEVCFLFLAFLVDFVLSPSASWIRVFAPIGGVVIVLIDIFRKSVVFSGGAISDFLEKKECKGVISKYKFVFANLAQIISLSAQSVLLTIAFVFVAVLLCIAVFFVPFILLALVGKAIPSVMTFLFLRAQGISITMTIALLIGFLIVAFYFLSGIWFSSYSLLVEGRQGIDAIATSFAISRGKRWSIFWRFVLVSIISALPIIILIGPIYWEILKSFAEQIAIAIYIGLRPAIPDIPSNLVAWKTGITIIADMIALPVFMILNYFLWKDLKASAKPFEEAYYNKARKWISKGVWLGVIITVIYTTFAVFGR